MRWACISSPPLCRLILDAIKDMRERAQADRKQRIYSAWQTRRSCGRHRVEPWSERKGRGVAPLRSALVVSISSSSDHHRARVYLPLTFELRFVCALGVQPASQSASHRIARAPFDANGISTNPRRRFSHCRNMQIRPRQDLGTAC
jgi:hypothetical protein